MTSVDDKKDNFWVYCVVSLVLHALLLSFAMFDIVSRKALPQPHIVVDMRILPASDLTNIKERRKNKTPTTNQEDAKKVDSHEKTAPKVDDSPQQEKTPKVEEKKPEPQKTEEPKKEEPKKDTPKVPDPKKEEPKKEDHKTPETKKEEPKQKESKTEPKKDSKEIDDKKVKRDANAKKKKVQDDFDSLFKTLEENSEGNNSKSPNVKHKTGKDGEDVFSDFSLDDVAESMTHDDLIRAQIERNWKVPIGASGTGIRMTLHIIIMQDGTVANAEIVRQDCPMGKQNVCNAAKDSMLRATKKASPLQNLMPSDYDTWKDINLHFGPL